MPETVSADNALVWEALTEDSLTAHARKEMRSSLFAGHVLVFRCDEAGKYYVASLAPPEHTIIDGALSEAGTLEVLVTQMQKMCRNSAGGHELWEKSKEDLSSLMRAVFERNMAHVLAALPNSGVVAVVRTLDDLDTVLDPPRFGDALVKFMPHARRPRAHELMLGMKSTQDRLDALLGRGSAAHQSAVLENYSKRFNYDYEDGLAFQDMSCKLFDRAQVRSVEMTPEKLAAQKREQELERDKRVESGKNYRLVAREKRDGKVSEEPASVSLVNELKAAQLRRKSAENKSVENAH